MKTELSKIAQDLQQGRITENEARTLLLGLLGVGNRLSSDELMAKAKTHVAYKWLDDKGKIDFESGILTGYGWAFK